MTDLTQLDVAHAAMNNASDDDKLRMKFYHQLSDATLFLLLAKEPVDEGVEPEIFDLPDATYVLAFDTEDRMAEFAQRVVPYVALSGRVIAGLLQNQNIGLGLNLDVAPSSILLPPNAISWLCETLDASPDSREAAISTFHPPRGLDRDLVTALAECVLINGGAAGAAYLVSVTFQDATTSTLIGFVDAPENAHEPLAKSVSEALIFSGSDANAVGVGFFVAEDPVAVKLAEHGVALEIARPKPPKIETMTPKSPGSDPDSPPKLR